MPIENLVGTFGGSAGFIVGFVAALLVLVAWILFQVWTWRRRRAREQMELKSFTVSDRERWIADLRRVADAHLPATDEAKLRRLHQELARQMRAIVSERSNQDVSSWSVNDMRMHSRLVEVVNLLASWERPSFAPDPRAHAVESVDEAIAVVSRW